jgi:O-6-methylguanine DNA methyltransferase
MTRPSTQLPTSAVEDVLGRLAAVAPPGLAPATLVSVGLADLYATMETPIGELFVAWNGVGISFLDAADDPAGFEDQVRRQTGRPIRRASALPPPLAGAIARRLAGDRRVRVALDLRSRTAFERAVWLKALEIPRGEVRPYAWVAAEIGRPRAVRAVGSALAHNPIPLVVPCHRVVRSDGRIGQYSLGGPAVKRVLLATEGLDTEELEALARTGTRFVGASTTRILCLPTCHHARRIQPRNRVPFASAVAARQAGYRACSACRPLSAALAMG